MVCALCVFDPGSSPVPRRLGSARGPAALVCALVLALAALPSAAQLPQDPEPAEPPAAAAGTVRDFDPDSPRGALYAYIVACRAGDYEAAAEYLDLSGIPEERRAEAGPRLARHLKVVLDQTLWLDWSRISNDPRGFEGDDPSPLRDRVGRIDTSRGPLDITLERKDGRWLIARSTVENIPALWDEYGYGVLGDLLPPFMFELQFLDAELWQWLALMLAVVAAYALSVLLSAVALRVIRPLVSRSRTEIDDELLQGMIGPLRLVLLVALLVLLTLPLGLSVSARGNLTALMQAVVILAFAWFVMRLTDLVGARAERSLAVRGRTAAGGLVPIGRRLTKLVVGALALLAILQNLGFQVTGLIAGLGVGGLAIALAAQKTLENMFGAVTLATDQPVRVGDFCRYGDQIGTIEEIGLRSTRVRTLDRTVVTIPNAEFASLQLDNFARRDRILLRTVLGLRYETTPDQLRFALAELRRLLLEHPKVHPDPARVRFVGFGAFSLDLEIFAYVLTSDWNEFLAIREDILLRIMDVVESSGSSFAFPSQTVYTAPDEGLDEKRTREAEHRVVAWRERGELPFPDFAEATRRELKDALAWPPEGSASAAGGRASD